MASIFSKIISGEIQSYRIEENDKFIAFLDINPLAEGHTLVVPKEEIDYLFDIADNDYSELWIFAKKVAAKLKSKIPCKRIGVAVIGLEVAHAHIHLIPINQVADIDFSRPKLKLSNEQLQLIAAEINS